MTVKSKTDTGSIPKPKPVTQELFGQLTWGKRPRTLQVFPVKEKVQVREFTGMQDLFLALTSSSTGKPEG